MRDRRVLKRRLGPAEAWRGTKTGMWAWLIQRLAALGLLAVIALHLQNPFVRPVQAAVLTLVLLHGLLGVRAILLDFGLPARVHRTLFLLALLAALAGILPFWRCRWYSGCSAGRQARSTASRST